MAAVDETKYLQLAEGLAGFRNKLRTRAEVLDIAVRQQILRLLVKEVLVGTDTITLRHSIPIPQSGPGSNGSPGPSFGVTTSRPNPGYLLRSGSHHSALRGSRQRFPHRTVFHHPGLQPLSDQLQNPSIRDSLPHQHHQLFLIDAVEVALNVRIDYEVIPLVPRFTDRFQGLRRAPLWTKSVTARFEIRLKDRLDDDLRRHLRHPVPYRRDGGFIMHFLQ